MKKQMKKASQVNSKFVIIIGSEELESQTVKIKDFDLGEEKHVKIDDIITYINTASKN